MLLQACFAKWLYKPHLARIRSAPFLLGSMLIAGEGIAVNKKEGRKMVKSALAKGSNLARTAMLNAINSL